MPRRTEEAGKAAKKQPVPAIPPRESAAEEDFGGGDFCSPEVQPSTDDDKPLD